MADNAPLAVQPSDEEVAPLPQAVQEASPHEEAMKDSDQPPVDPVAPILDEKDSDQPPIEQPLKPILDERVPPSLGNQSPVQLASGPSIETSAHDQSPLATGIPQEEAEKSALVESTSAAEVAKPNDEAVMIDASVKLESEAQADDNEARQEPEQGLIKMDSAAQPETEKEQAEAESVAGHEVAVTTPNSSKSFYQELSAAEGYESGTEEEQTAFRKDVESFYRENNLEFKAPKFYKEDLNLLKLWRAVIKLGGYEQVTTFKLWRQVGESFRPPKTCTTVSWTFRIFYEKALLEYEKSKLLSGELPFSDGTLPESLRTESQAGGSQALGSGRARRESATRAMQGWHSQRLLDNGEVCHPIIKDKNLSSAAKVDNKQLKTNGAGLLKRKKPSGDEIAINITPIKTMRSDTMVTEIGSPAEWVKINIQKTSECFEIYALVPGLLREEVHVQSDPAGRVIISGQPEQLDNPWGITPFKKVVSLPCRIDPHHTSAVVTLHGQLFVRVPFEQQGH